MTAPRGIDTPERAKANKIRERLTKEIEHIDRQRNLTPQGRRARHAKAVVKARDELSHLRADEAQRVAQRRDELTKDLFGHVRPGDARIISIRDATDRASRVTDAKEAERLMNRAEMTGDEVLLQALARECAQRSNPLEPAYGVLFQQWANEQPVGADTVDELSVIADEMNDTGHRLMRDRAFSITALPGDIRGIGNLRALATEADDDSGVLPPSHTEQAGKRLTAFVQPDMA
ncbi:MAG: hypothetical protein ACRDRI_24970 [Pseudonocardiaceae bacterium]